MKAKMKTAEKEIKLTLLGSGKQVSITAPKLLTVKERKGMGEEVANEQFIAALQLMQRQFQEIREKAIREASAR